MDGRRPALLVFALALVVAVPLYLIRGHNQWFFLDDWDFLAARTLNVHDLFAPHNEHWSTLPILVYRTLWQAFGIRSYVPYQLPIIALHLTVAALLRAVMRRAGVTPWIATGAAVLYVFLGAGRADIVWGFQIGFVGSVAFGLGHLLLADHDGPVDRRDVYGIGLGLLGLLCSGVSVTMVAVVGVAVLYRRGWKAALINVAPLAATYAVWFVAIGHGGYVDQHPTIAQDWRFVYEAVKHGFAQIGQLPGLGLILVLLVVVSVTQIRRARAAPFALLAGALIFFTITALGRAELGTDAAHTSRYVDLLAVLTLPAIAVGADALVKRWRYALPVVLVIFVAAIPGNLGAIRGRGGERYTLGQRTAMLQLAHSAQVAQMPPQTVLKGPGFPYVTAGWLRAGVRSGRIPSPPHVASHGSASTRAR